MKYKLLNQTSICSSALGSENQNTADTATHYDNDNANNNTELDDDVDALFWTFCYINRKLSRAETCMYRILKYVEYLYVMSLLPGSCRAAYHTYNSQALLFQ